ncbi:MAG: bacteriohemerythrin [Treponema sp.]|nr:bacteriohemerythrin [Treponema sp.]
MTNQPQIVTWEETYKTKIPYIDNQHLELVNLINDLYRACLTDNKLVEATFKESMKKMVDYVRFHFSAELELLKKIKYPYYNDHKAEHDSLIKRILEAANEYQSGKKFVPHSFVRTLKDWVLSHIAVTDKQYSSYVMDRLNKGLLDIKDLEGPH